ncbi:MAG TPA: TetR/AcrR family transcriptional regulator [Nannocystaceae bacterium]|nr:TetR/AcrR family transcriptional regulator [Nannocystaceae bacterium]
MHVRARKEEDKQARRRAIVTAAASCLGGRSFPDVTMNEIAACCGLGKGTLYLYFHTKEELFLAVLEIELADWLDSIAATLPEKRRVEPQFFAQLIVQTLARRETLTNLLTLQRTMLEKSPQGDVRSRFARAQRDTLETFAPAIERALGLVPGEGVRIMTSALALVIGLRELDAPASADAPAQPPRTDVEPTLLHSLTAMLRGLVDGPRRSIASVGDAAIFASPDGSAAVRS